MDGDWTEIGLRSGLTLMILTAHSMGPWVGVRRAADGANEPVREKEAAADGANDGAREKELLASLGLDTRGTPSMVPSVPVSSAR